MKRTALTALGLGLAAVSTALTPLENVAARIAAHEEAKPYLSVESRMHAKASYDELLLDYKRYNDGIEEMRKRKASDAERIAFAKEVRNGAEARHAERVWKALTSEERDLMVRLACKTQGVTVLLYTDASEIVGLSNQQRDDLRTKHDVLSREHRDRFSGFSKEWMEKVNAAQSNEEQKSILEAYAEIAKGHYQEYERKRAAIDAAFLASLTPSQRKRWTELTTLPKN